MFGSMVGFSRSADRMALLPVGPNPRWFFCIIKYVIFTLKCAKMRLTAGLPVPGPLARLRTDKGKRRTGKGGVDRNCKK